VRGVASVVVGVVGLAIVLGAGNIVWSSMGHPAEETLDIAQSESGEAPAHQKARHLVVHISGEVVRSGIITLAEGSRVIDAVEEAGGHTPQAALDSINLARLVVDGEHLIIPVEGEEVTSPALGGGLISISLASEQELQELPGVGPAIASRIVSWREVNGPFRHIDDLLAVSGIGPATLAKFRDLVTP
jgi:competence protein ComEA